MEHHKFPYFIHPINFPKGGYYGQELFDGIVYDYKPDIVFSLGDVYMVDWIPKAKTRNSFTWVSYMPIDSAPIPKSWVKTIEEMDFPVTYSKFGEDVIKRQVPYTRNDVRMIYHGVDTKTFYPSDRTEIRGKNKIALDKFILLYVGVNSVRKQIPRLLEAFDIFAKEKEDVLLWLHTSLSHNAGKEGWFLRDVINQYNIINKIILSKQASPVAGVSEETMRMTYNVADVFVSATQCEGFGLPFLEAAACGVPSIGVNYSAIPELIKDRGAVVPASDWILHTPYGMRRPLIDIRELSKKMSFMYHNKNHREQMGNNALEFALTMDWEKILPSFKKLIEDASNYNEHKPSINIEKPVKVDRAIESVEI